ncbi:NADPH-dependent F420 reductase [Halobellus limi]|uniref:NADPH-dependent F420 reductase n=1 Tax=Halobellus limi TaxID=699433 RepID=A0A1H6C6N8_9EURY|nr:NADPH-dependent F420 reductase [Halobellus limi]QCC48649.1 NADPH-dependent F420 reductase [Halobellus limi]SEG68285.1 reduced coenzyme F420:NADP oxidoreductase [Halobellus limi]
MRIALLGGTGDLGEGLALRWAFHTNHDVVIGSRDPDDAHAAADAYAETVAAHGRDVKITGFENGMATDRADVVVLAVPPYHVAEVVDSVADGLASDDVLVTPAAGVQRDEHGFHAHPPGAGSVTALVADAAPDDVPVVGALQTLPAGRLADLDADLGIDAPLVGDDGRAKDVVAGLIEDVGGLRAIDAGGLANAAEVESLTPLLINLARNDDDLADLGVRFR